MADSAPLPARVHWYEYGCELLGTAVVVFIGFSAGALIFGTTLVSSHLPGLGPRLFLAGLCFGGAGALVARSPLGQRSGAHLNPSVTITFFLLGRMHRHDFLGYVLAQFLGASGGAALAALVDGAALRAIKYDLNAPGAGIGIGQALLTEFAATALLLVVILLCLSFQRTARLTPFAIWLLVAMLVWQTALISGTGLNPARSFGSSVLAGVWQDQWIYYLAPSLAAVAVALGYRRLVGSRRILTAKLFHPVSRVVGCPFHHCAFCAQHIDEEIR